MSDLAVLSLALAVPLAVLVASLLAVQWRRTHALEAECDDLWHEAQDERQRCELLRDDLAHANRENVRLREDWEGTLDQLQRTRQQLELTHGTNRALIAARAAELSRLSALTAGAGHWAWVEPRHAAMGPYHDPEVARAEAEALAARYPGQDVFLLAAVDRVRVEVAQAGPVWEGGDRHPVELALAGEG